MFAVCRAAENPRYKFDKSWMRMMAMGITEQTYDSPSRLKPRLFVRAFMKSACLKLARK